MDTSGLANALTVIIGTAQLVRRAEEVHRPLALGPRMDHIEAAARRILHMLSDRPDAADSNRQGSLNAPPEEDEPGR
jgi:hypothetical protein